MREPNRYRSLLRPLQSDASWDVRWFATAWYGGALLLVILAPTLLWRATPAWTLPPAELPPILGLGAAYLALALFLRFSTAPPRTIGIPTAILASIACFGCA